VWEEGPHSLRVPFPQYGGKLIGGQLDVWEPELDGTPRAPRQRPLTPIEKDLLRVQTRAWLVRGVVEKTDPLPWTNNTVYVSKKNGDTRVCIDCTPVNQVTRSLGWPLPRLQDLRHHLAGAKWFSRMDLKDAFFRVGVPPCHRKWTAFTCDSQDYQFRRMPFGLKTAPEVFQRLMDHTLAPHKFVIFCYMDDILVHAPSRELLQRHTAAAKRTLAKAGMIVNEKKSEYDKEGLLFAGLWITPRSVGPNHAQVRKILALPPPRTKVEAQSVLGLVSYLRDHIPFVSHLTARITGAGVSRREYEECWSKLTHHIADTVTTLAHWDESRDADLYTDGSLTACAAVIIQNGRIVALASRKLIPAETRYSTTDREHLGLILACDKFKLFLHRSHKSTRVHTDHTALLNRRRHELTPRQARWRDKIETWIPTLVHVKGKDNPADFFSRWGLEVEGGQIIRV